jgi:hypothetical protein
LLHKKNKLEEENDEGTVEGKDQRVVTEEKGSKEIFKEE